MKKHAVFHGSYDLSLDAKHRLSVPSAVRKCIVPERDGDAMFAIVGLNRKIWLYTENAYEAGAEQTLDITPGPEAVEFSHMMYGMATRMEMDGQSRLLIPEKLLKKTATDSAVTLVGSRDHLEIWNQTDWAAHEADLDVRRAEIMAIQRAERAKLMVQQSGN